MHSINIDKLSFSRSLYFTFINSLFNGKSGFRFTKNSEESPFARCFAIFGLKLIRKETELSLHADAWANAIRDDLNTIRTRRIEAGVELAFDKSYLQLLTFSLSALRILDRLHQVPLSSHVLSVLSSDIDYDLGKSGALRGLARSGNHSMFMAILLIYARDYLGVPDAGRITRWNDLHMNSMNQFGFWGDSKNMTYLQFQNGYHQYEIFEYLGKEVPLWPNASAHVAKLSDPHGHFAPYPGGGGCYDYDAIFLITGAGDINMPGQRELLARTARTILSEQNPDGGFCESRYIRPRSISNLARTWRHISMNEINGRYERIRYGLTLLRPKHDRIHTHWSRYSRVWSESDLWDSWFRMLTLARIDTAFEPSAATNWGFIDFPGIGHHYSLSQG